MNDIGIKIVDSPKHRLADASPVPDGCENEVDPLSIDEEEGSMKDPLNVEVKTEVDDTAPAEGSDENAKDESVSEPVDKEIDEKLEEELLNEEELLKDDENSTGKLIEANIETLDLPEHTPPQEEISQSKPPQEEEIMKVPVNERTPSPKDLKINMNPKLSPPRKEEKAKATSPVKEVPFLPVIDVRPSCSRDPIPDIDMIPVPPTDLKVERHEPKPFVYPLNGDVPKEERGIRRRASEDIESDSPLKRLCQEVERTFPQHDVMINDYIQTTTKNSLEEIQRHTEQLLSEIQTLRELAQKKEQEWNNILHLKKVKEEILLRLLRRKQVLSFEKSAEVNGNEPGPMKTDPFDYLNQAKNLAIDKSDEISGLAIKQPGSAMMTPMIPPPVMPIPGPYSHMPGLPPPYDKAAHLQPLAKPMYPQPILMPGPLPGYPRHDMNGIPTSYGMPMGRQGPTKDVKSIIADYRQRNPEVTPRRGRRMKSILNPNMMNAPRPIAPKMDGMNSLNNLNNMIFNNLDMNQKAMLERLQQIQAGSLPNGVSFKDVLVQFANMQHTNAPLMPTRPMETGPMPRPDHHMRPDHRRRQDRSHEDNHISKQAERLASPSPRLPPPPPYPEISLLPVSSSQDTNSQQNSLLHGILTKQGSPASQSFSPTLAKLLKSPDQKQSALPTYGQAKNCGEITITPVQPTPPPPEPQVEKAEVVQLDDEESPGSEGEAGDAGEAGGEAGESPGGAGEAGEAGEATGEAGEAGRLVIDEARDETPLCQGCRRRDAQFVCAGCANQWYCSRDCQVAAWDDHSDMCTG